MLSPSTELAGKTVFVTGGLGFLGSVVVEQLLRLTQVKKVYLLARGKKQLSAAQRVEKLLCSSLFNLLHGEAASGGRNVFTKVQAVEGDMGLPGLGLSASDAQLVAGEVQLVIHCAASLELDAHIQKTLRSNYLGTAELLRVASGWPRLACLLFTSTYFVNNFKPRNSVVREQLHHLPLGLPLSSKQGLSHEELVKALLAMPPQEAEQEAAALMGALNFSSTYAFGKLLTEHLVNEVHLQGVSKVIVRPSLISAVAGQPYPGFINNYAGSPGFMMAYAAGYFHSIGSMAYASDYLLDLIPCDTVAALINAAVAAGAAAAGPTAAAGAKIYHAASAHCHPLSISYAVNEMARFWAANPPPMRLPFSRYFTYVGKHEPTPWGLTLGRWATEAKLWPICKLLEWTGQARKAVLLRNAFKALCVQNSFRYNRSIVSAVDNCIELRQRIAPAERPSWELVFDSNQDWDAYGFTFLAGVRRLLFRMPGGVTCDKPCHFVYKQDASAEVRQLIQSARSSSAFGIHSCSSSSVDSSEPSSVCDADVVIGEPAEEMIGHPAGIKLAVAGGGKVAVSQLEVEQVVSLAVDAGRVVVVAH